MSGFSCVFLPHTVFISQDLSFPSSRDPGAQDGQRGGSGSTTALCVTKPRLAPSTRGQLLTRSCSHGHWPLLSCSAKPLPSEITGTCTGEVAAGWPKQRAGIQAMSHGWWRMPGEAKHSLYPSSTEERGSTASWAPHSSQPILTALPVAYF